MLGHLALAVALRAVSVRRVQRVNARGLKLQLRHMGVDHDELLLVEQDAIGQT